MLYVLDEPSIGLHQRDNHKLIKTLQHLRDIGNTVLVVEHDEDTIRSADHRGGLWAPRWRTWRRSRIQWLAGKTQKSKKHHHRRFHYR